LNNLAIGEYIVYFKVRDAKGSLSNEVSINIVVLPDPDAENNPPTSEAGGPYSGFVNYSVVFDGSGSSDPDTGDTLSYSWYFGDGSSGEGVTVSHKYNQSGIFTVRLTVIDSYGEQSISETSVNITLKPVENTTNGNDGGGGKGKDKGIPGFEIIVLVFCISLLILFWKKKQR